MNNLQIRDSMRKVKDNMRKLMDKFDIPWTRFVILIVCGLIGIALYRYVWNSLSALLGIDATNENYIYIHSILLGLPVFTCLWWFRTRDVRQQIHDAGQQINKTETQIQQNSLFNGIANLSDKDSLKIDMGVAQLLELSKLNPAHDKTIRLAFIRRLKKCPLTNAEMMAGIEKLGYAQPILEWLTKKHIEVDLTNCSLDWQNFTKGDVLYNAIKNPYFRKSIITCTRFGLVLTDSEAKSILILGQKDGGLPSDFISDMLRAGKVNTAELAGHNLTDTSEN